MMPPPKQPRRPRPQPQLCSTRLCSHGPRVRARPGGRHGTGPARRILLLLQSTLTSRSRLLVRPLAQNGLRRSAALIRNARTRECRPIGSWGKAKKRGATRHSRFKMIKFVLLFPLFFPASWSPRSTRIETDRTEPGPHILEPPSAPRFLPSFLRCIPICMYVHPFRLPKHIYVSLRL